MSLYQNELPFRHVFKHLDGSASHRALLLNRLEDWLKKNDEELPQIPFEPIHKSLFLDLHSRISSFMHRPITHFAPYLHLTSNQILTHQTLTTFATSSFPLYFLQLFLTPTNAAAHSPHDHS